MKTLKLFTASIVALVSVSCMVPVYRGQGGGYGQSQRQLGSVNTSQLYLGHMEAQVKGVDPSNQQRVAEYAARVYEKTHKVPSEHELTNHFGFPCRAHWIDEPDKQVKMITVRPDEVPASIRAKFQ